MTTRIGPTQSVILLLLSDGTARSVSRIETDTLLSPGRARGALEGLGRRGLVDRDHTSGDRSGDHGIQWSLTAEGQRVAEAEHGLDETGPRCPHGTPVDWPCRECRVGPWTCSRCGEQVRGGQRAPHRFEVHGERRGAPPVATFTWAGPR